MEYNNLERSFKGNLEISSNVRSEESFEKFFIADFIKGGVDLAEAIVHFSKYCLQEYHYLIKTNKDKELCFKVNCMNEDIFNEFEKKNLWLDQLEEHLEADGSSIVYNKFKTEEK